MDFELARENMVASQILTNRVTDPLVISAVKEVPREAFAPPAQRALAYLDEDLAVAPGRHMMEPMVLARLLQLAEIQPEDSVLVIACGTGYSAAVISKMAASVVAIEGDPDLVDLAAGTLTDLGVDNCAVIRGDVSEGCPSQGPYDVIVIDGAVADLSPSMRDQLADGGRMVYVENSTGVGTAILTLRHGAAFSRRDAFDAQIPVLPEFTSQNQFVF